MSPPPTPARAAFSAAAFGNLRAASGEGQGEPLNLLLSQIDEDPGQPRTSFDEATIRDLASSIRDHGVLQPIVVRPSQHGRYQLAFGARRYRAARLAGLASIPAVIRAPSTDDYTAQLSENQHRTNLSDAELIAAIARLTAAGKTKAQIATICALKDYQIAAYRAAPKFPRSLAALIGQADIRALYDLYRQWVKAPDAVLTAVACQTDPLTITEARRLIDAIAGRSAQDTAIDRDARTAGSARSTPASGRAQVELDSAGALHSATLRSKTSSTRGVPGKSRAATLGTGARPRRGAGPALVFVVQVSADAEPGRLIIDRKAVGEDRALVAFGASVEEVALADLRIIRIE